MKRYKKDKNSYFSARLSQEDCEKFMYICMVKDMSKSELLRFLINTYYTIVKNGMDLA